MQRYRNVESFVGESVVVTDHTGSFQFNDLQPNQKYVLYTLCEPNQEARSEDLLIQNPPVLKTLSLETTDSGGLTELGELTLVAGLSLTGRVTFPADAQRPSEVKVRLSRDPAWDWCETRVLNRGEFSFTGLPSEVYRVSVNAPGFDIDASQFRYQLTGASQFGMRLRSDRQMPLVIPMRSK
ncbi:carboxypeptidase-like regulatory domain-containing protein [Novipirellula aureliae]|uniref:carboxypeptidase-like regulatory domain-containing protein n=1 Tax=Novipirellula aureliae TaxID=2527966 RepID=UPI0011B6BC11|nr:carboxypeptidase-like regulatory domain-containing protein [Novipirellula aureliae]